MFCNFYVLCRWVLALKLSIKYCSALLLLIIRLIKTNLLLAMFVCLPRSVISTLSIASILLLTTVFLTNILNDFLCPNFVHVPVVNNSRDVFVHVLGIPQCLVSSHQISTPAPAPCTSPTLPHHLQ